MPTDTFISFYLRDSKIHIFHKAIVDLGSPQFIRFRIHEDGTSMVMEAYSKKDFQSHRVQRKKDNWQMEIRSQKLCRIMQSRLNWDETQSYRIPGKTYPQQRIVVFDLSAAAMIAPSISRRQNDNE